ncbi:baseplate J/gp47 family protein [Halogeometricum sp. S1BR25-6]|uniref:Baseplate J/gp47 family protein n=1 Tax=Halogeometricum salsisoli TaxID=2950536 RepID=A0ABU2GJX7_9EURY|nr:baseplate J/gp47 family protein [Halogeometricum sp. S1BR25-6]MDS0301120.1 baseplate J/gp47 family protein [Halogeometricum sp. S1BR25-6]
MSSDPILDGRDRDEFLEAAFTRAPQYVPEWESAEGEFGTALLRLHAELVGDVAERADRLLEKHRAAFADALGFERAPPSPSRLAVSVAVTPTATANVPIPPRTRVLATGLDGVERTFEVEADAAFEATPARLRRVFSVAPRVDAVYDHTSALGSEEESHHSFSPFTGENRQRHDLYLGDDDLLTLAPGSSLRVLFTTRWSPALFRDCLTWEYHGVETDAEGTEREGWHPLELQTSARACRYSLRAVARRLADLVAERRPEYVVRTATDDAEAASVTAVAAALREWATDRNQRTERAVLDALLPIDATDDDRAAATDAFRSLDYPDTRSAVRDSPSTVTLDFTVRGEPTPVAVAGVESQWVRGRLPPGTPFEGLFSVSVSEPSFRVLTRGTVFTGGVRPDRLLYGVVPLSVEEGSSFRPLGPTPNLQDAFYVASDEAFTKRGERVTLGFTYADGDDTADRGVEGGAPTLSWEYWDGVGWAELPDVTDGTEALTTEGTVGFTVPTDLAPTSVVGREGRWIRARLVDGRYLRTTYAQSNGTVETETTGASPRYGDLRLSYNTRAPAAHVLTYNGFEYSADLAGGDGPIQPFSGLPDVDQTLYLGFDAPLTDGPLSILFDIEAREYPAEFRPRLRWERCASPEHDRWVPVSSTDQTAGLTERETTSLTFEAPTVPTMRFGSELHWLRARVTDDAFAVTDEPLLRRHPRRANDDGASAEGFVTPDQTGERLVAGDRTAGRTTTPPTLEGIHSNTGWARDVRTVEAEVLGSSDGSVNQSFAAGISPVFEETIWVDESATLSTGERADLAASCPEDVESVADADGRLRAFWVRWTRVSAFLASDSTDRHYTLDAVAGEVRFGDGVSGRIPPRGRENVRATYLTGGGIAGNVPPGAVTGLTSGVPLIEAVVNPIGADGGADGESTAAVLDRVPGAIRDRGRAVAAADLERIAKAAVPRVARAKCLPDLGPSGDPTPGWVTLVVVPDAREGLPSPSRELRRVVHETLREHVPASLVVPGRERLLVRGPNFVTVSVETTVVGTDITSVTTLEQLATEHIGAFLNPLTGGPGGTGWWFGELPSLSEVYAMLERIEGVDHVERLSVTYRGSERDVTVTEGEPLPTVAADVLAFGGTHDVTATGGR